jgi:hypothetical protein
MSEPTEKPEAETTKPSRLPYEPPAVASEEVFETLAATCGKIGGPKCQLGGGSNS